MPPDAVIVYEDNHLLVVNKPPNVPSQPDSSGDNDMLSAGREYIREKYHKPGNVFLGLIHRLDRPTSGLMMFARTSKAASRLSDQMRRRSIRKEYLAIVHGTPAPGGRLEHHLIKDHDKNIVSAVPDDADAAQKAVLTYNTLEKQDDMSLIQIQLITGRSHQIRVQFSEEGYPVWGDHKYGNAGYGQTSLALHAFRLQFLHPTRKERFTITHLPPKKIPWNTFKWFGEAETSPEILIEASGGGS